MRLTLLVTACLASIHLPYFTIESKHEALVLISAHSEWSDGPVRMHSFARAFNAGKHEEGAYVAREIYACALGTIISGSGTFE